MNNAVGCYGYIFRTDILNFQSSLQDICKVTEDVFCSLRSGIARFCKGAERSYIGKAPPAERAGVNHMNAAPGNGLGSSTDIGRKPYTCGKIVCTSAGDIAKGPVLSAKIA